MYEYTTISGCTCIGGLDLGFHWTRRFRNIAYIENDPARIAMLLAAMREGHLDTAPIWNDFTTFDGRGLRGKVDVFHAGIPCQGHSVAGKRLKGKDSRNLWPDGKRIIAEVVPRVVVIENVEGLYAGPDPYGPTVAAELESMGYVVLVRFTSAAEVGASHERMRTFTIGFLADADRLGSGVLEQQAKEESQGSSQLAPHRCREDISDTESDRWNAARRQSEYAGDALTRGQDVPNAEGWRREESEQLSPGQRSALLASPWETEPPMGRTIDGLSSDMERGLWGERIRALGNAVVPQVAYEVAKDILKVLEG